jgi:hypothetical protein
MVAGDEHGSVRQGSDLAVAEGGPLARRKPIPPSRGLEPPIAGDAAEPDDDLDLGEEGQLAREPGTAMVKLPCGGPIAWRCTARGRGDVAIAEVEPIVPADRSGLVREAEPVEGLV